MMLKYFLSALILSCLLGTPGFSQAKYHASIYGNWESVASKGGQRMMIKLKPDFSFILQTDLSADYSYIIKGDTMITKFKNENSGRLIIDTMKIKLKKDTLISVFKRNGKQEITTMVKTYRDKNKKPKIAGNYTWIYPNGKTAFSKFTKDGHWLFRLPIQNVNGKYTINKDIITFTYEYPDTTKEMKKFWLKGKLLVLTDVKTGVQSMYKKVDYFIEK